jgi:hypothetical protein
MARRCGPAAAGGRMSTQWRDGPVIVFSAKAPGNMISDDCLTKGNELRNLRPRCDC